MRMGDATWFVHSQVQEIDNNTRKVNPRSFSSGYYTMYCISHLYYRLLKKILKVEVDLIEN